MHQNVENKIITITLSERISVLASLGEYLKNTNRKEIQAVIDLACAENPWFTQENVLTAINAVTNQFFDKDILQKWIARYFLDDNLPVRKVGLVLAGNIPMVGFHDILCAFICNKISVIKYSEKDRQLIPFLIEKLNEIDGRTAEYFQRTERLREYDSVIATGSNNTAGYFEHYFSNVPHIIRKNRNAVAVLTGDESVAALEKLGKDIFCHFGLGCRNVSKLYLPKNYDMSNLIQVLNKYVYLMDNHKYKNNYDYNLALFLINREKFLQLDAVLLRESALIASRIGSLHYSYYDSIDVLTTELKENRDSIQCIVSDIKIDNLTTIPFGDAQCPTIDTYADGVDTISFLLEL